MNFDTPKGGAVCVGPVGDEASRASGGVPNIAGGFHGLASPSSPANSSEFPCKARSERGEKKGGF
jgi:hypothetical protein